MQPDREKYPDIPLGAQLSFNAKTGTYQVFREYYVKDSEGKSKKKKDSIGVINREGKFSFNMKLFRLLVLLETQQPLHYWIKDVDINLGL